MEAEDKRGVGRPTLKTEEVVSKLEDAFKMDFNTTEACDYAGVDRKTFYRWLKEDDKFRHKMDSAKRWATIAAKKGHMKLILEGDGAQIRFHLKNKAIDPESGKHEYTERNALDVDAPPTEVRIIINTDNPVKPEENEQPTDSDVQSDAEAEGSVDPATGQ